MDDIKIKEYKSDISVQDKEWIINNCEYIAVDTETTGLDPIVNNLCLIQIAAKNNIYVVQYNNNSFPNNIKELLGNACLKKVFHHATFDVRFLMKNLKIENMQNIICTKIGAKILLGIDEKNSLKDLLKKFLDITINKEQQLSDWSKIDLSNKQIKYAVKDVQYLVELWLIIKIELIAKEKIDYAQKCFDFLPTQAYLMNQGIENIFLY